MNTSPGNRAAETDDSSATQVVVGDPFDSAQLRHVADVCESAARGDLEARIVGVEALGDFGRLCSAINHLLDISDSFVRESAAAMHECGHDRFHRPILLRGLPGAYRLGATIINQAGLKMRESKEQLESTAMLADDTAKNISEIAAAAEELGASNEEIARQAGDSADLTSAAVQQANESVTAVQALHSAMQKIDAFLAMINKIAQQTNLLALNATIEAARAGEHGRGFAVVANEVKELSRSSAQAAGDIGSQIEAMRKTTNEAVSRIENVNVSVKKISEGASNISLAVQQQVEATAEISRNITAASQKTTQISDGIKSRSGGSNEGRLKHGSAAAA